MFNRIIVVQECDARDGDNSNEVGYKKYPTMNLKSAI